MQTFLPYPDFAKCAAVIDRTRLGNQRNESKVILNTVRGISLGWRHHPAVKMWAGYSNSLIRYSVAFCDEWIKQGYQDNIRDWFLSMTDPNETDNDPPWLGDERLHLSHQSKLISKLPEHYRDLFPGVSDDLEYFWPTKCPDYHLQEV